MPSLQNKIARNKKTLVLIVGIILALFITLKSNDLFSSNQAQRKVPGDVFTTATIDFATVYKTLKKNSQYLYQTYHNLGKTQN